MESARFCAVNNPLPPNLIVARADGGMLLQNLALFSSLLRRAGFGCGAQTTALAAAALSRTGVEERAAVFWALAAVYVKKREQLPIFRRAFRAFWRGAADENDSDEQSPDILSSLAIPSQNGGQLMQTERAATEHSVSAADKEILAQKDFAQMTESEWRTAMQINRTLAATLPPPLSRRKRDAIRGALDIRKTIRRALARGEIMELRRTRKGEKPAELIALVDISGSMSVYSRAFLHFVAGMYANSGGKIRARAFLLGTRLTAPKIRRQDARDAAECIAAAAQDWDGGTRLTPLLREFNRVWLKRTNAAVAVVLFVSDGLEINFDDSAFRNEVERLQRSCGKLVWLNPLLRYARYAPLARGAKILSQVADEIRPMHNVRSITQLANEVFAKKIARRGANVSFARAPFLPK